MLFVEILLIVWVTNRMNREKMLINGGNKEFEQISSYSPMSSVINIELVCGGQNKEGTNGGASLAKGPSYDKISGEKTNCIPD